jgi:putative glutathione S-transferase
MTGTCRIGSDPAAGRWRFITPFAGCSTLAELYRASGSERGAPASVPALYSRSQGRIVVNESARLIELLNDWPGDGPDLWPPAQREAIERWRERLLLRLRRQLRLRVQARHLRPGLERQLHHGKDQKE